MGVLILVCLFLALLNARCDNGGEWVWRAFSFRQMFFWVSFIFSIQSFSLYLCLSAPPPPLPISVSEAEWTDTNEVVCWGLPQPPCFIQLRRKKKKALGPCVRSSSMKVHMHVSTLIHAHNVHMQHAAHVSSIWKNHFRQGIQIYDHISQQRFLNQLYRLTFTIHPLILLLIRKTNVTHHCLIRLCLIIQNITI